MPSLRSLALTLWLAFAQCARIHLWPGRGTAPAVPADAVDLPKIDVHAHLFADRSALEPMLDRWRLRVVSINVPDTPLFPGTRAERWHELLALRARHPQRVMLCTTPDLTGLGRTGFPSASLAQLTRDLDSGAVMIKIWKDVGMSLRDSTGRRVQIDDRRFEPFWRLAEARQVPVMVHLADPPSAWGPLRAGDPDAAFYRAHPDQYPYLHPDMPTWGEIIAARDRWIIAHPRLTIVAAHLGNMADSLDALAALLDRAPNLYVETSARIGSLRRQPTARVRAFLVRYQDRVLYGTDVEVVGDEATRAPGELLRDVQRVERRLSGDWRYFAHDLALPRPVLEKLYHANAERLLAGDRAWTSRPALGRRRLHVGA